MFAKTTDQIRTRSKRERSMSGLIVFVAIAALLNLTTSAEAVLPQEIPVAAVFDEEGDPKLQLAFVHGIDRINQDPTILPGKMLVPQIVMIPAGKRFESWRGLNP